MRPFPEMPKALDNAMLDLKINPHQLEHDIHLIQRYRAYEQIRQKGQTLKSATSQPPPRVLERHPPRYFSHWKITLLLNKTNRAQANPRQPTDPI